MESATGPAAQAISGPPWLEAGTQPLHPLGVVHAHEEVEVAQTPLQGGAIRLQQQSPGAHLHRLGLWPVRDFEGCGPKETGPKESLDASRRFVDQLLGTAGAGLPAAARVEAVRLEDASEQQKNELKRFLHAVDSKPLREAVSAVAEREDLWIGPLRPAGPARKVEGVELLPWRNRNGKIARWSGLVETDPDEPPALILRRDEDQRGDKVAIEVRWKAEPADLEKGAATWRVAVVTDLEEELAFLEVQHSARKTGEKCRFARDDFPDLSEDSRVPAKVVLGVVGADEVTPRESEDFVIRFGERPESDVAGGVGRKVRTFSEGLAELSDRDVVSEIAARPQASHDARKGCVVLRTPVESRRRRTFRVPRPSLIAEVENDWTGRGGSIGRWQVRVRASGDRVGGIEFLPGEGDDSPEWQRAAKASRRLAARFEVGVGVGQIHDDAAPAFRVVREYLSAWTALLRSGSPKLAAANTVEVLSLGGRTVGLIVLPCHPLRVAWHAAYDNLVLHAAFVEQQKASEIRSEFAGLDGAMFPALLPDPGASGGAFVFADTLGFHAVGMVLDRDREPKASVAILARALGGDESAAPTVGGQSAEVLASEVARYLEVHRAEERSIGTRDFSRLLHVHALRAGDAMTVARALGLVLDRCRSERERGAESSEGEENGKPAPSFSLELYPSPAQRDAAGRFIAEAHEKRRRGAGVLAEEDRWMLQSVPLPGGIHIPRLRWARKERETPETAAHLAIAFDTFESQVVADPEDTREDPEDPGDKAPAVGVLHAFGLLSSGERRYRNRPSPHWFSSEAAAGEGEKHPSRRAHTEALVRLQAAVEEAVGRHLGTGGRRPVLKTEISPDKVESLDRLHRLCDWVVTLDRHAGIEYFDSPHENREIFDTYVIDCVPERKDLGCLQLVTSTANLEEVRILLDGALEQMGLSRSRRNAEFLMAELKALSGRLAIRLTGHLPATSELVALAVSHANCRRLPPASEKDDCWLWLRDGFVVPVDDVRDLLPGLAPRRARERSAPSTSVDEAAAATTARSNLIHVSSARRRGLVFRFVEVKYRRDLRSARAASLLQAVARQTREMRRRWENSYGGEDVCAAFRAVRRARLARVLRFYADKGRRHGLPEERHRELVAEITRMVRAGGDYTFAAELPGADRGWVFCPEYAGAKQERFRFTPGTDADRQDQADAEVRGHVLSRGQKPS